MAEAADFHVITCPRPLSIMMRIIMRTTLTVEDDLLRLARQRAAASGLTLVEVVNRALRRGLAEDQPVRLAEPTLVYGDPAQRLDAATLAHRLQAIDGDDARRQAGL
jgi:hypothetical protein